MNSSRSAIPASVTTNSGDPVFGFQLSSLSSALRSCLALLALVFVLLGSGRVLGAISEGFEIGLPTSYTATTTYTLGSGTWSGQANGVIRDSTAAGVKNGTYSCQLRSQTNTQITTPELADGVGVITVWASVSSGAGGLQILTSPDNITFTQVTGSPIAPATTIAQFSFTVNSSAAKYVQFRRTTGTIRIDDVSITDAPGATPPTLNAAGSATVDAPFDVTFVDDATWRAAGSTAVTVGGTALTAGFEITSGKITFTPSASSPASLLQAAGASKAIVISKTGYSNATVSQTIAAGVANKLAISTQPTAPTANGGSLVTQPVVAIQDQYNNATTSTATVTAAVGAGTWTIGGTTSRAGVSGTVTFTGLTATSAAAVTGATINFTSTGLTGITSSTFNIPAPAPANNLSSNPTTLTVNSAAISGTTVLATFTSPFAENDVWYVFTPTTTGTAIITTTSTTSQDLDIAGWSGAAPSLTTGNLISDGADSGNTTEVATLSVTAGTPYYLRVFKFGGTDGSFTITAAIPTITASPSSISGLNGSSGVASASQNFSASGVGLSANITILAPTNFEVSTDNSTFFSSVPLTQSGGTVASTPVYVRLTAGAPAGASSGNLTLSSPGAASQTVAVSGTSASTPFISTSGTLTATNTTYGTASPIRNFTVSGANLTNDILLTSPAGYEISQTVGGASGYAATQTLTQSSGTVASTTIYVRLASTTVVGSYSGNVVCTSTDAITQDVPTVSSAVSAKALTVTGLTGVDKIYDRTTSATFTGSGLLSGVVNADTVSLDGTPTAAFANATVGLAKIVNVTGYSISGTGAGNYTLTQPSLSAEIIAVQLTVTGATASNKIYDRTTAAAITGASFVGVLSGDNVSVSGGGVFSDANAGTAKTVSSALAATGPDGGNYAVAQIALSADITAKNLTVSSPGVTTKTYDATNTATITGTLSGVVSGDTIGFTGSGTFNTANAGTLKAVTAAIVLTGTNSGNYTVTQPSGLTGTINRKSLTVTPASCSDKVYDGSAASAPITVGEITGFIGSETVSATATGVYSSALVGLKNVTVTYTTVDGSNGGLAINYSISQTTITGTSITRRPLTITAPTIASKGYVAGSTTTGAVTPGTLSGLVSPETLGVTASGVYADANVGTGKTATVTYTLANGTNGGVIGNYSLAQGTGIGDVTKANQTITMASSLSRTTSDADFSPAIASSALTITYTSSNPNVAVIVAGAIDIVGSGTSIIIASQAGDGNFNAASSVTSTLTVSATAYSENMGTPSGTTVVNSYTGWQRSSPVAYSSTDTAADVRTSSASSGYTGASGSGNVFLGIATSNARNFLISGIDTSSFASSNLSLSFGLWRDNTVNGITVEVSNDGTNFTPLTITQPASSSTWTLVTASGTIPSAPNLRIRFSKNSTTSFRIDDVTLGSVLGPVVTPSVASLAAFDTVPVNSTSAERTFTVAGNNTTADVVVTAPTDFQVSTTSGSGFGSSVTLTQSGGYLATTTLYARFAPGTVGTKSENIIITSTGATTRNIGVSGIAAKLDQTITFGDLTAKTYGDSTFGLTATASSGLTVSYTSSNTDVADVSGNIVMIVGAGTATITATQVGDSLYNAATSVLQTLTVNQVALTIIGLTVNNKTYDGTTTATLFGTPAYVGLVNSETFSVLGTASATFADATVGVGKDVTVIGYTAPSANYTVTQPTGLTANIVSVYADWASSYPGFTDTANTANPDGDSYNNLIEFAFGTNPTTSTSGSPIAYANGVVTAPGQPTVFIGSIANGVDFRAVLARRTDYVNAGLTYKVQFSADLNYAAGYYEEVTVTAENSTVLATDGTIDAVSILYPLYVQTSRGFEKPTFFRVVVSSN